MILMKFYIFFTLFALAICVENKSRYDNTRLYLVHLKTEEHLKHFQEIKQRSDCYTFLGRFEINKDFRILVPAYKVAEITDHLNDYNVPHEILVNLSF